MLRPTAEHLGGDDHGDCERSGPRQQQPLAPASAGRDRDDGDLEPAVRLDAFHQADQLLSA